MASKRTIVRLLPIVLVVAALGHVAAAGSTPPSGLDGRVAALESRLAVAESQLGGMGGDVSSLESRSLTLATQVAALTAEVAALKAAAQPAGDSYFLKLEGIKGESSDAKHKDSIELLSYSLGAAQTGTGHVGGGAGAGKVSFQDLHFTTRVSSASPALLLACASGQHIPQGMITVRKAGGEQIEYLKVTMTDILVTSYQTGGSSADTVPVEQISLNFATIKYEAMQQQADGSVRPVPPAWWDIPANREIQPPTAG